jgi:hypothetical protein
MTYKGKDLLGQTFSKLTVIEKTNQRTDDGCIIWKCRCSCLEGKIFYASGKDLRSGATKSCGCYNLERLKKYNEYNLDGEYGIGYTFDNREFYFDLEDFDKIKNYCWSFDDEGYLMARIFDIKPARTRRMHKVLLDFENNYKIDHTNQHKYDNRKENLRFCSKAENGRNSGLQTNNTSGIIGVYWDKRKDKWIAKLNGIKEIKNGYLGSFNKFENAVVARLKAEKEYFKEYAPQQHLYEQYRII